MVCTGNRQVPSSVFSAKERERSEGTGLKELGLRCQWGEESSLQDRHRNDPEAGNPGRKGVKPSWVRACALHAGGAQVQQCTAITLEWGFSRGNGDKSKGQRKHMFLPSAMVYAWWRSPSSSVLQFKHGGIKNRNYNYKWKLNWKYVKDDSNSLWSLSGLWFSAPKNGEQTFSSILLFLSQLWHQRGSPFLLWRLQRRKGLCSLFGTFKYQIRQWAPFKGWSWVPETQEFYQHLTYALDPPPYTLANEPAVYSRQMGSLEAAHGYFFP